MRSCASFHCLIQSCSFSIIEDTVVDVIDHRYCHHFYWGHETIRFILFFFLLYWYAICMFYWLGQVSLTWRHAGCTYWSGLGDYKKMNIVLTKPFREEQKYYLQVSAFWFLMLFYAHHFMISWTNTGGGCIMLFGLWTEFFSPEFWVCFCLLRTCICTTLHDTSSQTDFFSEFMFGLWDKFLCWLKLSPS